MSRGRPYEVVWADREKGQITMADRETGAILTFTPMGTELFDALDKHFPVIEESE